MTRFLDPRRTIIGTNAVICPGYDVGPFTGLKRLLPTSRASHARRVLMKRESAAYFDRLAALGGMWRALRFQEWSCRQLEVRVPCQPRASSFVRTLTLPVAPSVRFSLSPEFCSRSGGSSAFAAGQVKRQVTPEGA